MANDTKPPLAAFGGGDLTLTTSPHSHSGLGTARIMWTVNASLVPCLAAGIYFFGPGALVPVVGAIAGAMGAEWVIQRANHKPVTLGDGSAFLTGLLLGLILPTGFSPLAAALGGVVSIGIGKAVFGGLGSNIFNPALVGRAFLQACFPAAMTNWAPALKAVDAVSAATPLGWLKFSAADVPAAQVTTSLGHLFWGNVGGCIGETSAAAIIVGGIILLVTQDCELAPHRLDARRRGALRRALPGARGEPRAVAALPSARGGLPLRRRVHGDRLRDLADDLAGPVDLRPGHRDADHPDPPVRRPAGRRDVLHPPDERRGAAHQSGDAPARLRSEGMKTTLHMIVTLVAVGLLAGGALSMVNQATAPRIAEQERLAKEAAVLQVFPAGKTAAPLIADRAAQIAAGADPAALPEAYRVLDEQGTELGLAVMGEGTGFTDVIKLVLGVSADGTEIRGLHVVKDSETPGLGTKIRPGAEFPKQFREFADGRHLQPPLKVVKGKRASPNEVEAITAATISSQAVTTIANETVVSLRKYLAAHPAGGGS